MTDPSGQAVLEIFRETGAVLEGHFLLSSGLHSDCYLQCALVLQHPALATRLGSWLADGFRSQSVDLVVGPALGGIIIAHELARALGVRALFTERKQGNMTLGRGFLIRRDERVLLVEDVVTTGQSLAEVAAIASASGGRVVGACAVVDRRSDRLWPLEQPLVSLLQLRIPTYDPSQCSLCRAAIPLHTPGTRQSG